MLVRLDGLVGITLTTLTTRLVIKPNKFGTLKSEQFSKQSWCQIKLHMYCGFFGLQFGCGQEQHAEGLSAFSPMQPTHVALALLVEAHQVGENRE